MFLPLAMSPADAHALTMVAILAFALGSLATMFLVMAQNGKRNAELDLPELSEEEPPATKRAPASKDQNNQPSADWERDADWWKKEN